MTDAPDHGFRNGSRRDFLKTSAGTVLGASLVAGSSIRQVSAADDPSPSKEISRLESEELVLQVFDNGTFAVIVKRNGCRWLPDPWQGVACRVKYWHSGQHVVDLGGKGMVDVSKSDSDITLVLKSKQGVTATTNLRLDDDFTFSYLVNSVRLEREAGTYEVGANAAPFWNGC